MKVAAAVWLAVARLQREHGRDADFAVGDVIEAALAEARGAVARQSVAAHVSSHCVATCKPSPDRYRMLTRTSRGRVRLFREGDPFHPERSDGAITPRRQDIPPAGLELFDWYAGSVETLETGDWETLFDELLELGKESGIWRGIDPDEYVASLRAGWDD